MKFVKLLIFTLLAIGLSTQAFALTTLVNCTMSDTCGFGAGTVANGVLNFDTASTYGSDFNLSTLSWWNLTFQISWPANMSTNKYYLRETISSSGGGRWIQEYANPTYTFKPEGDYFPEITGVTNTSWHTVSIVTNATSNVSSLYIDGASILAEALTPSTGDYFRMQINTFNNGGNVSIDNLTLIILDEEAPDEAPTYNGIVTLTLDNTASSITVNKTSSFTFAINVTCTVGLCGNVTVFLDPKETVNYPLSASDYYSDGTTNQTIQDWIDDFAAYQWNDVVDANFSAGLAAARWYQTESNNSDANLNSGAGLCPTLNSSNHQFCVVTDEHGNVQLIASMASNQTRYELLHNFSKLLQHPTSQYLPCWIAYVNGSGTYDSYGDLCKSTDSASDADLRIAKSMRNACAKQESGVWAINSVNYCADYYSHMMRVASYDVIQTNGSYYLCNGYNNAQGSGCPQAFQSFRSDYYEISSFFDFAEYTGNDTYYEMGNDFVLWINRSLGTNCVPRGKTGGFNGSVYECDENCNPEYIDNVDTIRFLHIMGELCLQHRADIPDWEDSICRNIWETFMLDYESDEDVLPYELWSNSVNGTVKQNNSDYKAIGMWLPFAGYYDLDWTEEKVTAFFANEWDEGNSQPQGAGYMGAYYGSFMIRGLGTISGLNDALTYAGRKGGLVSTNSSATPFYTTSLNPQSCSQMNSTSAVCRINWTVYASGDAGTYTFFAFTDVTNGIASASTSNVSVTLNVPVIAANTQSYVLKNKILTETLSYNSSFCDSDMLGACSNIVDANLSSYIMKGDTSSSYNDWSTVLLNFTTPANVSNYTNGTITVVSNASNDEFPTYMEYYNYATSAYVNNGYSVGSSTDIGGGLRAFTFTYPLAAISQGQPIQLKFLLINDSNNRDTLYEINATINYMIYYSGEDISVMCYANDSQNDRLEYNYTVYKDSTPLITGYRGGTCQQDYAMTEPACKTHYTEGGANTTYNDSSQFYYIVYTKPTYATSDSIWTVNHGVLPEYNISFATGAAKSCWDSSSTHLRLAMASGITEFVGYKSGWSGVYCYNYLTQSTTSIGTFSGSTGKETTSGTCTTQMDDNSTATGCVYLNGWAGGCYVPSAGWEGGCSGALLSEEHMTWTQRYASGVNITLDTVDKSNFTRENNITMSCSAYDGSTSSIFVNSTPADLTNADPTLSFSLYDDLGNLEANLTGLTGEVLDNLMVRMSSLYDLEGEALNVTVVVTNTTVNRTSQSFNGSYTGASLNASNFTLPTHDIWTYNITIRDPYLGRTSYVGNLTAPNVAPNITDIDYYKNNFAAECRQDSQDCRLEFDVTEDGCANVAQAWIHFTALSGVHVLNDTTLTLSTETEPNMCVFKSEDFMPTMSGTYTITAYYQDASGVTSTLVENMTVNEAINGTGGPAAGGGGQPDVVIINGREVAMSVSPLTQTIRGVIGGTTLNEFRVVNEGKDSFKIDVYIDEEASSPGIKNWVTFGNTDTHEVIDLEVQTAGALNSPVQFIKYRIKVPTGTTVGDYQIVMRVVAEDEVEQVYVVTLKVSKGVGALFASIGDTTIFDMRDILCTFADDKEVCVANKDPIPFKTKHAFYSFASIGALSMFMMISRRKRK